MEIYTCTFVAQNYFNVEKKHIFVLLYDQEAWLIFIMATCYIEMNKTSWPPSSLRQSSYHVILSYFRYPFATCKLVHCSFSRWLTNTGLIYINPVTDSLIYAVMADTMNLYISFIYTVCPRSSGPFYIAK